MPGAKGFIRPDSAKQSWNYGKMAQEGYPVRTLEVTINASDWSVRANPTYTAEITGETVVKSGLMELFGKIVGITMFDTEDGETGTVAVTGRHFQLINTGDTPAVGDWLYWDATAEELTTTVGANTLTGYCVETVVTLAANNEERLPAGDYVVIELVPNMTV